MLSNNLTFSFSTSTELAGDVKGKPERLEVKLMG
jgi:hypothetical protein